MVDLWECDDFDERVRDAVEVEQVRRRRLRDGFGGVLFHLDLFDADCDGGAVARVDAVVGVERDVAVAGEGLCARGIGRLACRCVVNGCEEGIP